MTEPEDILLPLRLAAKEIGMTELAKRTGITRSHCYEVVSEHHEVSFRSVLKVVNALGYDLKLRKAEEKEI